MRYTIAIIFFISGFLCSSCGERYQFVTDQVTCPGKAVLKEDSILYDSIGKFNFSRLSRKGTVGLFSTIDIPEKNQDQPLWIVFEGRVRSNYPQSFATIGVVGSNNKNERLYWQTCYLRYHITKINVWCSFKDSVFLTSQLNFSIYNKVNVFAYLAESPGERYDIDSLKITVRQLVTNI